MGIEYDIISDSACVGYELGKGPFEPEFAEALRSVHPVETATAFLVENHFEPVYAERIAREVVAFATEHPDWRIVCDCGGWDGSVVSAEEMKEFIAEDIAEGIDPMDFPLYLKIGSRYRE